MSLKAIQMMFQNNQKKETHLRKHLVCRPERLKDTQEITEYSPHNYIVVKINNNSLWWKLLIEITLKM